MMYIFEGVDHAGKDTLIRLLRKRRQELCLKNIPMFDGFNVHDSHLIKKIEQHLIHPEEWQKALAYETTNIFSQTKYDVIINRFTWSELVYGDALRHGADWDFYYKVMEVRLKPVAKVVFVTQEESVIRDRILNSNRNKPQVVIDKLAKLLDRYENLYEKSELNKIRIIAGEWYLDSNEALDKIIKQIFGDL